jgi:hypothetical protein
MGNLHIAVCTANLLIFFNARYINQNIPQIKSKSMHATEDILQEINRNSPFKTQNKTSIPKSGFQFNVI